MEELKNLLGGNCSQKGGMAAVGSKAQVWHGTAKHTSGGLYKKDLMKNKHGRIVSRKQHERGKKMFAKNLKPYLAKHGNPLQKKGYLKKKKSGKRKSRSRSRSSRK